MSPVDEPGGDPGDQPPTERRFLRNRWELFVIVTIAAIVLTVVLPAIQNSREASRRTHCLNNLKQISLAIHDYTTAQKVFPPGTICTMKPKMYGQYDVLAEAAEPGAGFQGTSFLLRVLGYFEGGAAIAKKWNSDVGISNSDSHLAARSPNCNLDLAMTDLRGFYCPTRRHALRSQDQAMMLSTSWTGGGTDYGGCAGRHAAFTPQTGYNYCDATTFYEPIFWPALVMGTETVMADVPGRMTQSSRIGVFGTVNRGMTFGEIRDGLSNTAMIGELQRITALVPVSKDGWAIGGPATLFTNGAMYRRLGAKSLPAMPPSEGRLLNNGFFGAPGSDHPGGANFGLADGSVTFVSEAIDPNVFALLASVADGMPLGTCD